MRSSGECGAGMLVVTALIFSDKPAVRNACTPSRRKTCSASLLASSCLTFRGGGGRRSTIVGGKGASAGGDAVARGTGHGCSTATTDPSGQVLGQGGGGGGGGGGAAEGNALHPPAKNNTTSNSAHDRRNGPPLPEH